MGCVWEAEGRVGLSGAESTAGEGPRREAQGAQGLGETDRDKAEVSHTQAMAPPRQLGKMKRGVTAPQDRPQDPPPSTTLPREEVRHAVQREREKGEERRKGEGGERREEEGREREWPRRARQVRGWEAATSLLTPRPRPAASPCTAPCRAQLSWASRHARPRAGPEEATEGSHTPATGASGTSERRGAARLPRCRRRGSPLKGGLSSLLLSVSSSLSGGGGTGPAELLPGVEGGTAHGDTAPSLPFQLPAETHWSLVGRGRAGPGFSEGPERAWPRPLAEPSLGPCSGPCRRERPDSAAATSQDLVLWLRA